MTGPDRADIPARPEDRVGARAAGLVLGLVLVAVAWAATGWAQNRDPGEGQPGAPQEEAAGERWAAILQGLDKTTARVSTVEAPIDVIARFGTLEIMARACHKRPPTETPESTAFLEIVDVRPDSPAVPVFTGWMFASSPAVSALEHPVYDVWVVDCRKVAPPQAAGALGAPGPAENAAPAPPQ